MQASESVLMSIGRYCPFPHQSVFVAANLLLNNIPLISATVLLESLYPKAKLETLRHSLSLTQIPYPLQFSPEVYEGSFRYEASFMGYLGMIHLMKIISENPNENLNNQSCINDSLPLVIYIALHPLIPDGI